MNKHIRPSAIIFDFDDTLVDAKPIIGKALKNTFAHFNIQPEIINSADTSRSLRDYFQEIFRDNLSEARDIYYKNYHELSQNLQMLHNAEEVLKLLKNNKVYTAIVSNKNGEKLRNEVDKQFNWTHYFNAVIGSGDAEKDKPSVLPAKLALEQAKLTHYKDVWFIGDSLIDIETANNLGCVPILFGSNTSLNGVDFFLNVDNHATLLKLLRDIYNV